MSSASDITILWFSMVHKNILSSSSVSGKYKLTVKMESFYYLRNKCENSFYRERAIFIGKILLS